MLAERRCLVLDIAHRQEFSGSDGLDSLAHQNTVHDHTIANAKTLRGEFVFGRHILRESVSLASEGNPLAGFHVGEGDQNIVARIELEHVEMHRGLDVLDVANSPRYCKTLVGRRCRTSLERHQYARVRADVLS